MEEGDAELDEWGDATVACDAGADEGVLVVGNACYFDRGYVGKDRKITLRWVRESACDKEGAISSNRVAMVCDEERNVGRDMRKGGQKALDVSRFIGECEASDGRWERQSSEQAISYKIILRETELLEMKVTGEELYE